MVCLPSLFYSYLEPTIREPYLTPAHIQADPVLAEPQIQKLTAHLDDLPIGSPLCVGTTRRKMNPIRVLRPVLLMVVLVLMSVGQVSSQLPPPPISSFSSRHLADVNGDGKADLVWRHAQTGHVVIWLMNGLAIVGSAVIAQVGDLNWQIVGVADLNGDGKSDLVWRHTQSGHVAGWLMNGLAIAGNAVIAQVGDLNWQITGIGDLDGDRKDDLVWYNTQTGDVIGWLMNNLTIKQGSLISAGVPLEWQIQ